MKYLTAILTLLTLQQATSFQLSLSSNNNVQSSRFAVKKSRSFLQASRAEIEGNAPSVPSTDPNVLNKYSSVLTQHKQRGGEFLERDVPTPRAFSKKVTVKEGFARLSLFYLDVDLDVGGRR